MFNMLTINSTLNNFYEIPIFHNVFSGLIDEYEYTENEIFPILVHHQKSNVAPAHPNASELRSITTEIKTHKFQEVIP